MLFLTSYALSPIFYDVESMLTSQCLTAGHQDSVATCTEAIRAYCVINRMIFLTAHNKQSTSLHALKQAPPPANLFQGLLRDVNYRQAWIYSKLLGTDLYQKNMGFCGQTTHSFVAQLDSLFQCL